MTTSATAHAAGEADAPALVLSAPLSFWGGIDVQTGRIIDHSHPDLGTVISGRILVMSGGRGSSSSSAVFAESIRRGTGPAGVILGTPDPILTVGALVAEALYGVRCPVVVCEIDNFVTGERIRVRAGHAGEAAVTRVAAAT